MYVVIRFHENVYEWQVFADLIDFISIVRQCVQIIDNVAIVRRLISQRKLFVIWLLNFCILLS